MTRPMDATTQEEEATVEIKTYGDVQVGDTLWTENGGCRGTVRRVVAKRDGRVELHMDRGQVGRGGRPMLHKMAYQPATALHGSAHRA